jgi:hypothetical protein
MMLAFLTSNPTPTAPTRTMSQLPTIIPSPSIVPIAAPARSAPEETLHRCETCGITEGSHPEAEFRVASDGKEYCTEHLPSKTLSA